MKARSEMEFINIIVLSALLLVSVYFLPLLLSLAAIHFRWARDLMKIDREIIQIKCSVFKLRIRKKMLMFCRRLPWNQ